MAGRKVFDWSTETDDRIRTLYIEEKLTGSQIAAILGGGLTRAAVQGRLARLGLKKGGRTAKRAAPATPRPKEERLPSPPRKKRPKAALPAPVAEVPQPGGPEKGPPEPQETKPADRPTGLLPAMEATGPGRCKAPLGDPAAPDFAFCGDPVGPGGVYCAAHERLFYRASSDRR